MVSWKHINFEQRKTISSCVSHNYKLINIAKILSIDPRSISREVKRNRIPVDYQNSITSKCSILKKWPFVCTNCKLRYRNCSFNKLKYDAKIAQKKADANLIISIKGIDLDSFEFKLIDSIIKDGVDKNKSIYQIKVENNIIIKKSLTTLYRYINNGYLKTKR